jgi:hypothetical protein
MSNEYVETVGRTLKDRLRAIEWEPLPKRLADLLSKVRARAKKPGSKGPGASLQKLPES